MGKLSLFERALFEAPEDEAPPDNTTEETPPDQSAQEESPPDQADESGGEEEPDSAPDMDADDDQYYGDDGSDEEPSEEQDTSNLGLDGKISEIMNVNLYQRYVTLLHQVNDQLNMIKNNRDIMNSISDDVDRVVSLLRKLDENMRLYMEMYFVKENYSKNLLFFNKCLNLLKLINDSFGEKISKGIKKLK